MKLTKWFLITASVLAMLASSAVSAKETVRVYNWDQYIAPSVVPGFEKATDIHVIYDIFDTNEVLQAKLLSGQSGYDVVVPSNDFMARQIQSGAFMKLDKSKISNWKYLSKPLLKKLEADDPGNQYSVPYMVDITGIAYNPEMVKKALGKTPMPKDSWKLVFDPVYMKKLKSCGVAFLDSPSEVMASVLMYEGLDPNSTQPADYEKAEKVLSGVRPYVRYFDSGRYLNDLANGNICVAIGWNGDALMANNTAKQARNGVSVKFEIPKEGALLSFDMLAIPKGAPDYDNALKFINYVISPKVMAENTNTIFYGNAVPASREYLSIEARSSAAINPTRQEMKRLVVPQSAPPRIARLITRLWDKAKTGY